MRKIFAVLVALVALVCSVGMVGAATPVQSDQLLGQGSSSTGEDGPLLQGTSYKTITLGQSFYSSWRWYYYPSGAPVTGRYATLQSSNNYGSWNTIASGTTNSNGVVGWTIKPPAAGNYRYRTVIGSVVGTDVLSVTVNKVSVRVAEFSATPTSGSPALLVRFTDRSTATPSSWRWEFGDGTTSTARNPSHYYSKTGTYTVKLTVKYSNGQVLTKAKSGYIRVGPRVADFSATPTYGKKTLLVRFTDKSTATPSSWRWEFGDGTTSTARNPSHYYTRAGTYTVKLTVKYSNGQVLTKTRVGDIRVIN